MSRGRRPGATNQLRIIGGRWRGRRLRFPDAGGLRPTGDRVRETVFNWLQADIAGARCLDLFAGSGAMAFEALSRGAAACVLVERNRRVAQALQENAKALDAATATVVCDDALGFLKRSDEPFDVVFLDPPFDSDIIGDCCRRLETGGWLTPQARIYLEQAKERPLPALPPHWEPLRSRSAGQVGYHLLARNAPSP